MSYVLKQGIRVKALSIGATFTLILSVVLPTLSTLPAFADSNVTVSPSSTSGWTPVDDNGHGGSSSYVSGPSTPPLGVGSAQLSTDASNQGYMLFKAAYGGTKLSTLTALSYSTYVQQGNNTIAPSLQINIDKDTTDVDTSWQGRLTYEPYYNGSVIDGQWQTWNTLGGKWWFSSPSKFDNNCGQSSPCTLSDIISAYPNIGVSSSDAGVGFKAGSGWTDAFIGNVDNFTINDTTYDFEPTIPDTTKPTVSFTSPSNFTTPFATGPNIAITATDAGSGVKTTVLHVYNSDGTAAKFCATSNSDTTSCDTSALPEGDYYVKAGATDNAGNIQTVTKYFTIDKTAPTVPSATLTQNSDNATVQNGESTNSQYFTFHLNSNDATRYQVKYWNDIPGSQYNGESNAWNAPDLSSYSTSLGNYVDNFTQGEGTHYFAFSACDAIGNCSSYASPYTVIYDKTAPNVAITSPGAGEVVNGSYVNINATIADVNPDHYFLKITQNSTGDTKYSQTFYGAPQSFNEYTIYTWDTTVIPDGLYTVQLEARDAADNKDSGSVTTKTVTVDNTAPDVTINSYTATANVITPSVTASDPSPSTALTYKWTANDSTSTSDVTISDDNTLEPTFTALADGNYGFTLTVTDQAGNSTAKTFTFTYATPPVINSLGANASAGTDGADGTGGTGGNTSGAGGTANGFTNVATNAVGTGGNGIVLGASTTTPNAPTENENGEVKGASTVNDKGGDIDNKKASNFLDLGWWWLPILAAVAGIFYWILVKRADSTDSSSR